MSEEEKKWEEEAREEFRKLDDPYKYGSYMYFQQGYLQACKVRQEEIDKLTKERNYYRNLLSLEAKLRE